MNQNPEQIARDNIDTELIRCGWVIQNKFTVNKISIAVLPAHEAASSAAAGITFYLFNSTVIRRAVSGKFH